MRWASAVETDSNLSSAIERAAGKVFAGLGRQEPDLLFVFVGADHAPRFDAVSDLLLREFEGAFLFGSQGEVRTQTMLAFPAADAEKIARRLP